MNPFFLTNLGHGQFSPNGVTLRRLHGGGGLGDQPAETLSGVSRGETALLVPTTFAAAGVGAYIRTEDYLIHSGNATNDLNDSLLASWPLATNGNESLNVYNLSVYGVIAYSGGAAVLNGTPNYLYNSSLDLVDPANNSFSIWAEVTVSTSVTASGVICSQYGAAGTRQWQLIYDHSISKIALRIYNSSDVELGVAWSSTVTLGATYYVAAWFDAAADAVFLQINNGTPVQSGTPFTIRQTTTSDFRIGACAESGAEKYYNGTIRRVRLFRGWCLTAEQRSALYNAGTGIDYPFSAGTAPSFTANGAVMAASFHDLTVSGSDARDYVNDTRTYNVGRADEYDAINSYAFNAHHYNLFIDNFRGTALRIGKGSVSGLTGLRQRYDHEVTWADNIQFQKVFRGIRLDTIDCKLTRVSGETFRDYGIWAPAGAAQIETVHLYGGDVGLWLGGKPLSGQSFCSNIEVENCRIGLLADANGSVVTLFRSFTCFSRNALLKEGCQLNDVSIEVEAEDATYTDIVGVEIQSGANLSRVTGLVDVKGTSTGIKLGLAHQCSIDIQGNLTGAGTGVEISAAVDDCEVTINMFSSVAGAVALDIIALGARNRIRVNARGNGFTNPIRYPGGGTTYNLSSPNEVYLNGVLQRGIGYPTGVGVGDVVTQPNSKANAVAINKLTGQITMHSANLPAAGEVMFTVTNSTVAATDVVIVNHASVGTAGAYVVQISSVSTGSFNITVGNVSNGTLGEAIVLNFAIIKGANT